MTRSTSIVTVRRPDSSDESGVALVMVVGSMLVLAMFAMVALAYTLSSQKFARYDQDYSASVSAAQSGAEDYVSRLNRKDTYAQTVDCTNVALRGPMPATSNTCGWNPGTAPGWLPVQPGETNPDAAWFHYQVDATKVNTDGTVVLTVTGREHGVYRSMEVAIGKGGSTDYVYYTDFESADPDNVQAYASKPAAACGGAGYSNAKYWYNGRSTAGCQEITFVSGDELDGSVFTNDAVLSSGALFKKGFLTAFPDCSLATGDTNNTSWNKCLRSGSTANFNNVKPLKADPKYLDDTSAAFATHPGCHYFGSTRVVFNAAGTMTVWNKTTNNGGVGPTSIAPPGGTAPNCGTVGELDRTQGVTVPVPNEMVIYVATSTGVQRQCYSGDIGGPAGHTLPLGTYDSTSVAVPTASGKSYTVDTNMTESPKYCGQGNLYVEGVLKGRTTVSADQSVIATGDLVLAGGYSGADMLGIVATISVEVFHPQVGKVSSVLVNSKCKTACAYKWDAVANEADVVGWPTRYADPATGNVTPTSGILIVGSIQTLQHSFLVQKYAAGSHQGDLTVFGSIAQRWRGIVGQSGLSGPGYLKKYSYDPRLKYSAPPYFPKWADSQWSLRYSGEVTTAPVVRNSSP